MSLFGSLGLRVLQRHHGPCCSSLMLRLFSSDVPLNTVAGEVSMTYDHGLPTLFVPLPSRQEKCQFTLKPISHTVKDICDFIKLEDKGAEVVALYSTDGNRIASSTPVEHLLRLESFHLRINDVNYVTNPPQLSKYDHKGQGSMSTEEIAQFGDVRSLVASLHATLNVDEHQIQLEIQLLKELEELKIELMPLEKSYEYHEAGDRIYLTGFHKGAKKLRFDVLKYNQVKENITAVEHDLKRLRDPFYLHLPLHRLRNVELRQHLQKAVDQIANR